MNFTKKDFTQILNALNNDDVNNLNVVLQAIYDELHRLASRHMQRQFNRQTMNTTSLVHEAYLRLIDQKNIEWQSRAHFFNLASQAMRHILVDYARSRKAAKRGGGQARMSLDEVAVMADERSDEWLAVHEALNKLEAIDSRQSKIVELRYFIGLTIQDTAATLGISPATVKREWIMAKAWLVRELKGGNSYE